MATITDSSSRSRYVEDVEFTNPYDRKTYKVDDSLSGTKRDRINTERANQQELDIAAAEHDFQIELMHYQNEYDSPAAQAQRMREAGLNPDLQGIESMQSNGTQGVTTPQAETPAPIDTTTQLSNVINTISGVASTAVTAFSAFKTIPIQNRLAENQSDALELANMAQFEKLVYGGVSDKLADSVASAVKNQETLDISSWLADEANFEGIFESYAPRDDARYRAAYSRAIKNSQKILGQAYSVNKDTAGSQTDFAQIASNPYYSDDVVLQLAYTRPMMEATEKLRLLKEQYEKDITSMRKEYAEQIDVTAAADLTNAKTDYERDFWESSDGAAMAKYEKYIKEAQSIIDGATGSIVKNWRTVYNENPDNARGLAAAYLIMNRGESSLAEYLSSGIVTIVQPRPYTDVGDGSSPSILPNSTLPSGNGVGFTPFWQKAMPNGVSFGD